MYSGRLVEPVRLVERLSSSSDVAFDVNQDAERLEALEHRAVLEQRALLEAAERRLLRAQMMSYQAWLAKLDSARMPAQATAVSDTWYVRPSVAIFAKPRHEWRKDVPH